MTEKYVSVAGGGSHDGSSEANAWTWDEMRVAIVAGERANVKAGSYSLGAGAFSNSGTNWQTMIIVRGYNSTIGDLDGAGRLSDTELDTTNFPNITITGGITPGSWTMFQNLYINGSVNGPLITGAVPDNVYILSSRIVNSANNSLAQSGRFDNSCTFINSDFECTAATHGAVVQTDSQPTFIYCRIRAFSTSATVCNTRIGPVFFGNGVIGNGGKGLDISLVDTKIMILSNTFYNCSTDVELPNAVATWQFILFFNNHATDSTTWIDNQYSATEEMFILEMNTRTRDVTTPRVGVRSDSYNINEITTDTGGASTDYVDAPNGDITLISSAPAVDAGLGI